MKLAVTGFKTLAEEGFATWFTRLRGFEPYPWQAALFRSILNGAPPSLLYIPTGGGKTDVLTAWLLAVSFQMKEIGSVSIPRRLYFAVDRRNVVDQAETNAQEMRLKIEGTELFSLLQQATTADNPLVVSILRGQKVTEQEPIISDPSSFAIVLCTPDMALSRLLFAAYGSSPRVASREAGLVGHDAWVVLDEAHLSDAGRNVLEFVKGFNHDGVKQFWHTSMSATPRNDVTTAMTLLREDLQQMKTKLKAHKHVKVIEVADKDIVKNVRGAIARHTESWTRTIIYIDSPRRAAEVSESLANEYTVQLLTGTMRNLEKSRLDFSAFKQGANPTEKVVLVCTSAGEVGLDVSSDILITEFTYLERLAQRWGRLNRWGESSFAYGYVIRGMGEKESDPKQATLDYLQSLPKQDGWIDVSNWSLYQNPAPEAAFSPVPKSLALNEVILAQLANTSVEHNIPVDMYIRGMNVEYNVNMVVRNQAELDAVSRMTEEQLEDYVAYTPVLVHEIFREAINKSLLTELRNLRGNQQTLFVSVAGKPEMLKSSEFSFFKLRSGTLYLPSGCIDERGMFAVGGTGKGDVFDKEENAYQRFIRDGVEYIRIGSGERFQAATKRDFWSEVNAGVKDGFKAKIAFEAAGLIYVKVVPKFRRTKMLLTDHLVMAQSVAEQMVESLNLKPEEVTAIIEAAKCHDVGKAHPLWQAALRGTSAGEPLAKLQYFNNPRLLSGMRHELVSALMSKHLTDLALWLVVSHHGRCRPFFSKRAYDPERTTESMELNARLPFLLEHLVAKYGYWGLAYLEAVLRGIDIQSEGDA